VRSGLLVRGEIADRVKPWTVELLLPAGERPPEGVEVGFCTERSNVSVYAALHAAGCPRLAFLLTDLDPRDPLDEEMASWKLWLVRVVKRAERVANSIEVIARWAKGEIDAETARELLSRRVVRLREWYEGFLVPASYLHKLSGDELAELREKALKGDLYAAARLAIDAELERLKRMVEAGFPDAFRIFDRFVDALGELGLSLRLASVEEKLPGERLRELEERGVGRWTESGRFEIVACRADQVPEELKWEVEVFVIPILKSLAKLLVPVHLHGLGGFLLASVG
jgi:hypothetical protein